MPIMDLLETLTAKLTAFDLREHQTLVTTVAIIAGAHVYYWHKYSFWSRRNVKTPPPVPLFGNLITMLMKPKEQLEREWPRRYGRVYGSYLGVTPYLTCADAKVMKEICIRDFDKFTNHFFLGVKNKYLKHFLIIQEDDYWRGMRNILSPTFASGRIKTMFKILHKCADELIQSQLERIDASGGGCTVVDLRTTISSFTMSSAVRSFYGINMHLGSSGEDSASGKHDDQSFTGVNFAMRTKQAFQPKLWRLIITQSLPNSILHLLNFPLISSNMMDFFNKSAKRILRDRESGRPGQQYNDYLNILLEARLDAKKLAEADSARHEDHHTMASDGDGVTSNGTTGLGLKTASRQTKTSLTEEEVSCQIMMLMMVATETTSILIVQVLYQLAHHQAIQEQLYEEIKRISRPDGSFDYDQLTSCEYLDCCLSETLRLRSPALAFDRVAKEDYLIEDYNILVPKGTVVNLAFHGIHYDPDYWPEPASFKPERFLRKNKDKIVPGSYCPFGIGPRACIGFRFALTEAKLAVAKLLSEFSFEPAPGTKYPPEPARFTFVLNEHLNLKVIARRRH